MLILWTTQKHPRSLKSTSKILKGKETKRLKKRQARSSKKRLAKEIKALATVVVQIAFSKATKVYVPSIFAAKLTIKKLVRVPRNLTYTTRNARIQPLTKIMIGSIPVSLDTIEYVMVTFTEEDNTLTHFLAK